MKKTIMAVILTVSMFILTCVPVYADDKQITVTADASSSAVPSYEVVVANNISLSKNGEDSSNTNNLKWIGSYSVNVVSSGHFRSMGKYVKVAPKNNNFVLRGTNDSSMQYTATVSQTQQKWQDGDTTSSYLPFGTASTGNISVSIPKTANDVFSGILVLEYGVYND